KSESRPCNFDWIGTPSTGSTVCAAITPAKCAAPPAPAMMTRSPRSAALRANSAVASGVRCAESTRDSLGRPSSSSISTACRIVETVVRCRVGQERTATVVTGDGIVGNTETLDLLTRLVTVVWVTAAEATLFERASRRNDRHLLQQEKPFAVFSKLFRERESL